MVFIKKKNQKKYSQKNVGNYKKKFTKSSFFSLGSVLQSLNIYVIFKTLQIFFNAPLKRFLNF